VDVNLAWAIAALFLGAFLSRRNAARQHAAEVHAAREQAFEAMQRDTWLALQDALLDFYGSLIDVHDQSMTRHRQADRDAGSWGERPELAQDDPVKAADDRLAYAKYLHARIKSVALRSRLADSTARRDVGLAIAEVSNFQKAIVTGRPRGTPVEMIRDQLLEPQKATNRALNVAIERLGVLISQRPEPPTQPWRWPRLGRRN
jgi:hypothetical protein